jgi:ribosomal subunit interface protein
MIINFKTNHVTETAKSQFENYATERFQKLKKKLLSQVAGDAIKLDLNLEHVQKHNAFILKINLTVPGKVIHHEEAKHQLKECIDLAYDNIKEQLRKHMEQFQEKRGIHHKHEPIAPNTESKEEEYEY